MIITRVRSNSDSGLACVPGFHKSRKRSQSESSQAQTPETRKLMKIKEDHARKKVKLDFDNSQFRQYKRLEWQFEIGRKSPPNLPPHFLYTPLNSQDIRPVVNYHPSVKDVFQDQRLQPMINHLYFVQDSTEENYQQIGLSIRHKIGTVQKSVNITIFIPN